VRTTAPDPGRRSDVRFVLLSYGDAATWDALSEAEVHALAAANQAFERELFASGEWLGSCALLEAVHARTVRVVGGTAAVAAGPHRQDEVELERVDVVDCETVERALEIAARAPAARYGPVELRTVRHDRGDAM
jgi:hypothetical protein